MSELTTVARPYAKASFDYAVEQSDAQALQHWSAMLQFAAAVATEPSVASMLAANLVPEKLSELFIGICADQLDEPGKNLIRVMAENGRLAALPQVAQQFELLRSEHEKVVKVDVTSAAPMSQEQLDKLQQSLVKHFGSPVELSCVEAPELLGGFIARAGDLVIDNSLQGQLKRMSDALQS